MSFCYLRSFSLILEDLNDISSSISPSLFSFSGLLLELLLSRYWVETLSLPLCRIMSLQIHFTSLDFPFESESESEVAQSCPTLWDPVDCSLPGSSLHGILQERILECVAISFSRGSSRTRNGTQVLLIAGRCFNL